MASGRTHITGWPDLSAPEVVIRGNVDVDVENNDADAVAVLTAQPEPAPDRHELVTVERHGNRIVVTGPEGSTQRRDGDSPPVVHLSLPSAATLSYSGEGEVMVFADLASLEFRSEQGRLHAAGTVGRLSTEGQALVSAANVEGDADVKNASEVDLKRVTGNCVVVADTRPVSLQWIGGDATVNTTRGNITVGGVGGLAVLTSAEGNIFVSGANPRCANKVETAGESGIVHRDAQRDPGRFLPDWQPTTRHRAGSAAIRHHFAGDLGSGQDALAEWAQICLRPNPVASARAGLGAGQVRTESGPWRAAAAPPRRDPGGPATKIDSRRAGPS